jgi:Arc-like DNA binding domain
MNNAAPMITATCSQKSECGLAMKPILVATNGSGISAAPKRAVRRRKPQDQLKRAKFGMHLPPDMLEYLAAQASSNGRSVSEEIADRLETSRMADDAWGGPRVVALLRTLAAIAAEHRGWLDDHATFNLVRDRWMAALKEHEPRMPTEVERRIAKYRVSFAKLADQNLSPEVLDQLASMAEIIATEDRQLPEEVRTEFALKGLEAGARARALGARGSSSGTT